jgi:hypothetical protein
MLERRGNNQLLATWNAGIASGKAGFLVFIAFFQGDNLFSDFPRLWRWPDIAPRFRE